MPVQYDLPEYSQLESVEDVNKYNKLPFYLALQEAKRFPEWNIFNNLFGKINWKPNMGTTMRAVRAEPSPVAQAKFYPAVLTGQPNKNIYEVLETSEDAVLHWHDFDSKKFYFLPSFQDFRENQLDFAHKDVVRQIAISNDIFLRTVALQKAPFIFIAGDATATAYLQNAPTVANGTPITAATEVKNDAYFAAAIAGSNVKYGLTLALLDYVCNVFRDDIGAPFFENAVNMPRENELIKGKYVLIGSSEAYQMFKWDPNFSQFRNINLSVVNDGFRGSIFDEITYKTTRHPLRIAADGSTPVPEVIEAGTNRTINNPAHINAPYEVAFLVGADAFKSVKIGPPPRAFSTKKINADKFYSMKWNAEVQLTDQVLVEYNDGGTTRYDLNSRGRLLKFQSTAVMGMIPLNQRHFLPILFKRVRPQIVPV